jgi:hypothetical protein
MIENIGMPVRNTVHGNTWALIDDAAHIYQFVYACFVKILY